MYKWYLPTLSEILAVGESERMFRSGFPAQQRVRAEREWCGAIAALHVLLQQMLEPELLTYSPKGSELPESEKRGVLISGSLPVLHQPELLAHISTWTFTPGALKATTWMPCQLLPAANPEEFIPSASSTLPLLPNDPLAMEQFCLVLTNQFSLVMALGEDAQERPALLFSFEPDVVWQAWRSLRSRLLLTSPESLPSLESRVNQFIPVDPDYRLVTQFSRTMLAHLPEPSEWERFGPSCETTARVEQVGLPLAATAHVSANSNSGQAEGAQIKNAQAKSSDWQHAVVQDKRRAANLGKGRNLSPIADRSMHLAQDHLAQDHLPQIDHLRQTKTSPDTELLQAIAHEVRTPLTTIRTLTRLLLRRKDLGPEVIKRLEVIDRECTQQIDRFSLIFRAVELETTAAKHPLTPLAAISLAQVFQQCVPRWQQQASQRNLTLDVVLPQKLPMVVSDPTMLDQVLTGLIDRITHTLPSGSHIQVQVMLAGHQLKLQFHSQPQADDLGKDDSKNASSSFAPSLKSIGQLLMFQPETGNLSLNLSVTKNLFQALGGKLIVRHRPHEGEVLTIFLPLETRRLDEQPCP